MASEFNGPERRREIHVTCAKENDWGELKGTLKSIAEIQSRIEKAQADIYARLLGNGHEGLIVTVDRNKQAVRRLWWWVGGGTLIIAGSAIAIIVEHFKP